MKLKENSRSGYRLNWRNKLGPACAFSLMTLLVAPSIAVAHNNGNINCDVVIIGGGPGGVHTAFRLATESIPNNLGINRNNVCLFEKNDYLGGRIEDKPIGKHGELIATGAMRMPKEHYTYKLMQELNLPTQDQLEPKTTVLGVKNGYVNNNPTYTNDASTLNVAYGLVDGNGDGLGLTDFEQVDKLACGAQVVKDTDGTPLYEQSPALYGKSITEYGTDILGQNGMDFLKDVSTFKADFLKADDGDFADAVSYMEYIANDYTTGGYVYAQPGFSVLIKKMADKAENRGVNIYMKEAVKTVNSQNNNGSYKYKLLTSKNRVVNAKYVIIAINPGELSNTNNIGGNIINQIRSTPELKIATDGHGTATTVSNQWNVEWWNKLDKDGVQFMSHPQDPVNVITSSNYIRRGGTTETLGDGLCITRSEISNTNHWNAANVTRSLYIDDPQCAVNWYNLYKGSVTQGNKKLIKYLAILYPRVFDPMQNKEFRKKWGTPEIRDTAVTIHPWAWNNLAKGAWNPPTSTYSNESIAAWSAQPLANEKVYLVSDGYTITTGWSTGAFMSSVRVLNTKLGMNVPVFENEGLTVKIDPVSNGKYVVLPKIKCTCDPDHPLDDCHI